MSSLVGARVTIHAGPFASFSGIVRAELDGGGFTVDVEIFGHVTPVDIAEADLVLDDPSLLDDASLGRHVEEVLEKRAWGLLQRRWIARLKERTWTDAELAQIDDVSLGVDPVETRALVEELRAARSSLGAWLAAETERLRASVRDLDVEEIQQARDLLARAIRARQLAADPTPIARDPALETEIEGDPDRLEAYAVYGDWLQARGDPRGELVALQLAGKSYDDLLARHRGYFVGALDLDNGSIALDWKGGFIRRACFAVTRDQEAAGFAKPAMMTWLFAAHSSRFLRELVIKAAGPRDDGANAILEPLVAEVRPTLRRLEISTDENEYMLSWTGTGDLGRVWPRVPALRELRIHAGGIDLGAIDLPELRDLAIETCNLTEENVESIAGARWPNLRRFILWFGSRERGAISALPVARRLAMPALRELGFANTDDTDALCESLPRDFAGWAALEALDLSRGAMTDAGARALASSLPPGLRRLDVSENFLTDDGAVFERPGLEVRADDQRVAEIYQGETHRYCAVIE